MVNRHSKSVTKPKFELQPHIALKKLFCSLKNILYLKTAGPSSFYSHKVDTGKTTSLLATPLLLQELEELCLKLGLGRQGQMQAELTV